MESPKETLLTTQGALDLEQPQTRKTNSKWENLLFMWVKLWNVQWQQILAVVFNLILILTTDS